MAPKKGNKKVITIKQDFIESLRTFDLTAPAELTTQQLARAYGLANPRSDSQGFENLLRTCGNRWLEDGPFIQAGPVVVRPEVETIVIDSDDDDDAPKKPSKGKGKAKEKEGCCSDHCASNPRCLNWLGQSKWEDAVEAMKDFRKGFGLGSDPSNMRDPDIPVGLKNLGATCYVNSFLQVWFQDEAFRSGVYACLPPADGKVEASPLFQLQVVFAFLQSSEQAVYDPEPLVTSLKLDKGEQQDSQEFSKLFLGLLDHEFKKQGQIAAAEGSTTGRSLATLVEDQFQGSCTFGTQCSTCHTKSEKQSTFHELEINLTKNCKLEDRIRESLQDEHLTGDNKYECGKCQKKRDAIRSTVLEVLPPVLHISLLRFVFSAETASRSKSQDSISYPLKLNMGQFLPALADGSQPEVLYDLKGVLMHKGTSAHHGHYVAQVHDGRKNKWFLFDDETVSPIDDLNDPTQYDEDGEPVVAKKNLKKKNGFFRDASGEIVPKSSDAYMLVYARRESGAAPAQEEMPPPLAASWVERLDRLHGEMVMEYIEKESQARIAFDLARESKRSVYRVWDVLEEDEETFMVSKVELRSWLLQGLTPPKDKETLSNSIVVDPPPSVTSKSNGSPAPKEADTSIEAQQDEPTSPANVPPHSAASQPEPPEEKIQVDSTSEPLSGNVISNSKVVCQHGMVDPTKADQCKRVSQLGIMAMRELGVTIEPELVALRDFCRECVFIIAAQNIYHDEHQVQLANFLKESSDDTESEESFWISKPWLTDWKKVTPKMHAASSVTDPHPGLEPWASDVTCPHGALQPDSKRRMVLSSARATFLNSLHPDWTPISTTQLRECALCKDDLSVSKEGEAEIKKQLTREKGVLKSLDNQARLSGGTFYIPEDSFVIPHQFARDWLAWTRRPAAARRPQALDNSHLFCEHDLLIFDINAEGASGQKVDAVSEAEWKLLKKNYNAGPEISVYRAEGGLLQTVPGACPPCLEAKRKDFSSTEIHVKRLTEEDFDEHGNRKDQSARSPSSELEIIEDSKKRELPSRTYASGTRSSARISRRPVMQMYKQTRKISMEKTDSVKDLKIRIDEELSIPTIYQRLFYQGRELENHETVEALGLYAAAVLELFEIKVDENVDLADLVDADVGSSRPKRGGKGREEGFGGTGLFGWESQEKVGRGEHSPDAVASGSGTAHRANGNGSVVGAASRGRAGGRSSGRTLEEASSPARPVKKARGKTEVDCPQCTFRQVVAESCEMCGLPLPEQD